MIFKIIKEFLYGIVQVIFGSAETNIGIAVFFLMAGIAFIIIPDAEKPKLFYLFGILSIVNSGRIFYFSLKKIMSRHKE